MGSSTEESPSSEVPETAEETDMNVSAEQLIVIGQNLASAACSAPTLKGKLKSRKFWVSVLGAIIGVLGMFNMATNTAMFIASASVALLSILGYCFAEGVVDAIRAKQLLQTISAITAHAAVLTEEEQRQEDYVENINIPDN